ncbi:MAG: hypothetical protein ACOCVG_00350 [Verrucomicrobiota bacterium]
MKPTDLDRRIDHLLRGGELTVSGDLPARILARIRRDQAQRQRTRWIGWLSGTGATLAACAVAVAAFLGSPSVAETELAEVAQMEITLADLDALLTEENIDALVMLAEASPQAWTERQ